MQLETDPTLPGHPGLLGCQSWSAGRAQGPCVLEAVPTMLFSLYGMNFENMPELKWPWGYPLVLSLTVGIGVGLHRWFKRSGWL